MKTLTEALALIEAQQKTLKDKSPAWCVGEQLKDILRSESPAAIDLVATDLEQEGMGIADCEKKIADFASAHRQGNTGFCGPADADRIIREFYGITITAQKQAARKTIRLADFME